MTDKPRALSRRRFLGTAAVAGGMLALPAIARAQQMPDTVEMNPELSSTVRRNASSFRALDWQPYFDNLSNGVILVDVNSPCAALLGRGWRDLPSLPDQRARCRRI